MLSRTDRARTGQVGLMTYAKASHIDYFANTASAISINFHAPSKLLSDMITFSGNNNTMHKHYDIKPAVHTSVVSDRNPELFL